MVEIWWNLSNEKLLDYLKKDMLDMKNEQKKI